MIVIDEAGTANVADVPIMDVSDMLIENDDCCYSNWNVSYDDMTKGKWVLFGMIRLCFLVSGLNLKIHEDDPLKISVIKWHPFAYRGRQFMKKVQKLKFMEDV